MTITSSGSVEQPKLSVELESNKEILNADKREIEKVIDSLFNLRLDLNQFYEQAKNDEVMSRLVQKLRGLKSPTTPTVFEALVDSITEQQISLTVAHKLENNIVKEFGDVLKLKDEVYYAYPTPQKLASATVKRIRECGLSERKAQYIKHVSNLIVDEKLNLEKLQSHKDTREIINKLDEIYGIGVWTAELTVLRGMHRPDAMPADDLGLRRHISHYYSNDRRISSDEARKIAEKWGKWKGLAGFYLIIARRLGVS
jgi:DNA-3-methyladenine glycosylase II